jgi:hypothetical protein
VGSVNGAIAKIHRKPPRASQDRPPAIDETLLQLEERARNYRRACAAASASSGWH